MSALSRRGLLAGAAVVAAGPALAQTAPAARVKGPLVWLNMDQKELDDAYDQAVYAPNRDIVIKRCVRNSELARERLGAAQALRLRTDLVRRARCVHRQDAERADHDLCPRRLVARRQGVAVPLSPPRRSSMPAPISSCPTSPMSATSAAACSPWPTRSAARWSGSTRTPRASAAIRSASTCPANRPAATGSACC